mmetsp:Transcript_24380/g.53182  ORF Transcript_24380/g.53182 Transcript_24380/m.53182 type:complete len:212 (+) Transcript_24380:189-824(+)
MNQITMRTMATGPKSGCFLVSLAMRDMRVRRNRRTMRNRRQLEEPSSSTPIIRRRRSSMYKGITAHRSQMLLGVVAHARVVWVPMALATDRRNKYSMVNTAVKTASKSFHNVWSDSVTSMEERKGSSTMVKTDTKIMIPMNNQSMLAELELSGSSRCRYICWRQLYTGGGGSSSSHNIAACRASVSFSCAAACLAVGVPPRPIGVLNAMLP